MKKRIETTTSRTAEWTCVARAISSFEPGAHLRSEDHIARFLLPWFLSPLVGNPVVRKLYKSLTPKGLYAYVVARTKYMDAVFRRALAEQFDQVLIFGAGFDTRALRFQHEAQNTRIFELDAPATQNAKISQYQKRHLAVPSNLAFVAIDFDKEPISTNLAEAGVEKARTLFVLEGVLMYLQPQSVESTFRTIQEFAGDGSWIVFDYVYASVLRKENLYYGESGVVDSVSRAGEGWHFGIERGGVREFLSSYGLKAIDQMDAEKMERAYFTDASGRLLAQVNGAHCLVTAEKR